MVGPLRRDGEAVELAGEADREIADIDHFLHFAEAFGGDLAGLQGDEPAKIGLRRPQLLSEQTDELAAAGCGHKTPGLERLVRPTDRGSRLVHRGLAHLRHHFTGDRRARRQASLRKGRCGNTQAPEERTGILHRRRGAHDRLEHGLGHEGVLVIAVPGNTVPVTMIRRIP
jgi:hypothetical protein